MATGFIVRNAQDVGSALDLAEPDALDFNMLSRHRYGVLSGCEPLVLSGWVFTIPQGTVLVNDALVLTGGQVTLPTSSQQPRFDLITIDDGGGVGYIRGTPSPNPVYPDFGENILVMAAVYITPGTTPPDAVRDVTDKRRFVQRRFLSDVTSGDLLASYAPGPPLTEQYRVSALGETQWMGDTRLFRVPGTNTRTLRVEDNLNVAQALTADSAVINHALTVNGDLSAANLLHGMGAPGATVGTPGDLYQDQQNGGLWSYESGSWQKLSTVPIPPGFIMATLRTDEPLGWLLLDGTTVDKPTSGGLWDAFPQWRVDANTLLLPDARGTYLRQATPGSRGGSDTAQLQVANMPAHKHIDNAPGGAITTGYAGSHTHTGTIGAAGSHSHKTDVNQGSHHHDVFDPLHDHHLADGGSGGPFIAAMWNGTRRLDGPFNDASHPVAVGEVDDTSPSKSNVSIPDGGTHSHFTDAVPPHSHPITLENFTSDHFHTIPERSMGGGAAFNILPSFLGVNYLIKT